jgi:RNA 2',3'-cyclic 3'-phosphodiesterase
MSAAASVEGHDRLRLFCGFGLPDRALDGIVQWQREHLAGRIVPRANLHVTIAFLGSRPRRDVPGVVDALRASAERSPRPVFRTVRYRETRSVGMLVLDDDGGRATRIAEDLQEQLEGIGVYRRERRPWLPHITVLRFRERPRLRPPVPDLGAFGPSDAAVYHSALRPDGAQYTVLESVALGG